MYIDRFFTNLDKPFDRKLFLKHVLQNNLYTPQLIVNKYTCNCIVFHQL